MPYRLPDYHEVVEIAEAVRIWCLGLRGSPEFAWIKGTLRGCCGIASYELYLRFKSANYRAGICFCQHHAFAIVGHRKIVQLVVDITASQFGAPQVLVEYSPERLRSWVHSDHVHNYYDPVQWYSDNGIAEAFRSWPEWQLHPKLRPPEDSYV